MSFDELAKKVNEFQPSDDPKADASQLAEYLEETLKFVGNLIGVENGRKQQETQARLHAQMNGQTQNRIP